MRGALVCTISVPMPAAARLRGSRFSSFTHPAAVSVHRLSPRRASARRSAPRSPDRSGSGFAGSSVIAAGSLMKVAPPSGTPSSPDRSRESRTVDTLAKRLRGPSGAPAEGMLEAWLADVHGPLADRGGQDGRGQRPHQRLEVAGIAGVKLKLVVVRQVIGPWDLSGSPGGFAGAPLAMVWPNPACTPISKAGTRKAV